MKTIPQVNKLFRGLESYEGGPYRLLPFKMTKLDASRYVVTNIAGEYMALTAPEIRKLADGAFDRADPTYADLKAKHFLCDEDDSVALELLAAKYRTKQHRLAEFTGLHIFVVTLRCDHSCQYCQVSRVSEERSAFDMSTETAAKSVELMFKSPSRFLKVEFQGGESLLNFEAIRFIVSEVKRLNTDRQIEFVIASNLSFVSDEILDFAAEHRIMFSCSLDGPPELHNQNRPRPGKDSHERTIAGIGRIREKLGPDAVSALMTTTSRSLEMPERIIDEYLRQGFRSVFLRWISPFGFAVKAGSRIGYDTEKFLEFYKRGLDYILKLNLAGTPFREEYAAIILRKMLTPYATGYVDLQSPAGLGVSVLVYNYDGDVYASDESRMLAETGDRTFRLGNVHRDSYQEMFLNSPLIDVLLGTMNEGVPGCVDCAFAPFCGTDPVFNHATQGNAVGHRPTSAFCRRNIEIIRHLISILESRDDRSRILKSWIL